MLQPRRPVGGQQPAATRAGHRRTGRPDRRRGVLRLLAEWDYGDYEGRPPRRSARRCPTGWCGRTAARAAKTVAAGLRARRPGHRVALEHMESRDVRVRRARALLPRGGDPLGRAAGVRGDPVRDGGGIDRGVRLRTRRAPDQRARTDRPPPTRACPRDARTGLRARRTAAAPSSPTACTPPTRGSPTRAPRWRRAAPRSSWAPCPLTSPSRRR